MINMRGASGGGLEDWGGKGLVVFMVEWRVSFAWGLDEGGPSSVCGFMVCRKVVRD
jgi:hypothetical protein